jgi:hypothetical protein
MLVFVQPLVAAKRASTAALAALPPRSLAGRHAPVTYRYRTLEEALAEMGAAGRGARIVVSWAWWDGLSEAERNAYRARCAEHGVALSADHRISSHFVEVIGDAEPPLSSERHV